MIQDIEKIKVENEKLKEIGKDKNLDSVGMIIPENCGTCRFIRKNDHGQTVCCRNTPKHDFLFPQIFNHNWCGEYQPDGVLR